MQAESHLELVNLFLLNAKLEVEDVFDQVRFSWKGLHGKVRSHVFDYVVHVHGGQKIAFAVKPAHRVNRPGFIETMQEVAWFATKCGFCDSVRILTEYCSDRIDRRNAQLFWAARGSDSAADEAASLAVENLVGAAALRDLAVRTGLRERGHQALIRLVAAGHLVPVAREIITQNTLVQLKG